ncbi:MAG: Lactaldehyde dehydrogenase [Candidatus Heimdallarchaeota archaeon LC_3]|nr:MAG: Lactaldehyde dehydrogenase [Candidatus Heimdallarchaeota archaeon LC_3]
MKHYPILLAGKERETKNKIEVINPYNQEVYATVAYADESHLLKAIDSAYTIFPVTRKIPSYKKSDICLSVAKQISERVDEIAEIIASESGKPMIYAKSEVLRCIDTFTIAAEESKRICGEFSSLDAVSRGVDRLSITQHYPVGVVAGISPFNFPLNLVAHKIAPALAVGSPIILKPASSTPVSALTLGKIITNTEWPKEGISIIPCSGKNARPLVEDPRVKILSFTGSALVGWNLKAQCGKKKIILELGGTSGVIVHSDANVKIAAQKNVVGAFAYSGQVCISVQRIFVHNPVFEEFVKYFKEETEKLITGDPLNPETTFSAMIDKENAIRVEQWVNEAVNAGAKVIIGGKREGATYPPTALTNVPTKEKVVCQEVFGPIVIIESYENYSKAIEKVNDSDFGLQAGVFTQDISRILEAYDKIDAGGIMINETSQFRVDQMPYGGNKDSGFGREGIRYSMEEYCHIKHLMLNESGK